ncbi:hypothetical protein J3W97_002941 [Listeria monocytogenes]|nr:hypothetical protein [Listeria monocytogenes]
MPVSERGEQVDLFAEETNYMEDPGISYWGPKRLREICIDKDYKFP